ncbi:MAG: secretin and TonB N-terminal domain-containing protein [Opitutaceae bacterium]|jgi:general secretion pathway protein D
MKKLKLPKSLLVTLAAPALVSLVVPAGNVLAQGQTETKIRLMADALRARDSGDLDMAKKNLEELLALAPNDATVQRLLSSVDTAIATRGSAAPSANATASAAPSAEPVEVSFPAKSVPAESAAPAASAAMPDADVLAKQENQRIKGLISEAHAKRAEARRLAKDGRFDDAAVVLDGAINLLPVNPATTEVISDLQAEKNGLLLEKAQFALKQGDTVGARTALEAYSAASSDTKKAERLERKINRTEFDPPKPSIEKASPKFIADQKEIAKLVAKGRSQYLAGDVDGSQETFRLVESIDVANPEAKSFLTRIATEKSQIGELNRAKAHAQMIEEVANAWQRPGVYVDRDTVVKPQQDGNALLKKLNSIVIPSVNFNGVELSKVISTLSAVSEQYDNSEGSKGANMVVIDPSNKNPLVSITLRNLSLKRILDLITDSTGYQYEVQADTIVVRPGGETSTLENAFFPVTRATVIRMTGIGAASATPAASADPFAAPSAAPAGGGGGGGGGESGALQAFLEQAGVRFSTTPGSSLVYDGSAIIVNQSTKNIERIRNILNRYNDVRQVEIEAKFMDVQEGVMDELGVNWTVSAKNYNGVYTSANRSLASVFGGSTNGSTGTIITDGDVTAPIANSPAVIPGSTNLGSSTTSGSFSNADNELALITGVIGQFDVSATIRALSQKTGTDLLSSPKVTVLSGNPANIVVAQELRYPQSYGETQSTVSSGNSGGSAISVTPGTPQEFTSRNVGVELKVTPTVEEDDYSISLDLNPRVTEFDGFVEYGGQSVALTSSSFSSTTVTLPSGFYQPIFSTREVTTKVTVWDGATLVLGGLTREEVKKVSDKVPFLGDIPFIGRAFRSKGESSSKRNLLIFVTANLVSPGGSPKKQQLKSVAPASIFQNPTIVTPGSAEPRVRGGGK